MVRGDSGGDRVCSVVGIVVNDSDAKFRGRVGLEDEGFQALPNVQPFVASWDDHLDHGRLRARGRGMRNERSQSRPLSQSFQKKERFQNQQRCTKKELHGLTSDCLGTRIRACNAINLTSVPSLVPMPLPRTTMRPSKFF